MENGEIVICEIVDFREMNVWEYLFTDIRYSDQCLNRQTCIEIYVK
jgi:hypothetical protein